MDLSEELKAFIAEQIKETEARLQQSFIKADQGVAKNLESEIKKLSESLRSVPEAPNPNPEEAKERLTLSSLKQQLTELTTTLEQERKQQRELQTNLTLTEVATKLGTPSKVVDYYLKTQPIEYDSDGSAYVKAGEVVKPVKDSFEEWLKGDGSVFVPKVAGKGQPPSGANPGGVFSSNVLKHKLGQ